jgi:hypothetical protein
MQSTGVGRHDSIDIGVAATLLLCSAGEGNPQSDPSARKFLLSPITHNPSSEPPWNSLTPTLANKPISPTLLSLPVHRAGCPRFTCSKPTRLLPNKLHILPTGLTSTSAYVLVQGHPARSNAPLSYSCTTHPHPSHHIRGIPLHLPSLPFSVFRCRRRCCTCVCDGKWNDMLTLLSAADVLKQPFYLACVA